ncbi:MAG TPA: dihydrofolate reductase family protein [Gaiellales bacterium]|jgi:dihydrofolate reductase
MRKVIVYMLISLDGVAEDPNTFITEFDEAMDENLAEVIGSQDTVLLGRRMYEEWSRYWPTSDIEPFASFINTVQKYVATSRPLDGDWPNAAVIDGELPEFVARLKQQAGEDIGVHGSISVAQQLLAAGLVDRLRLVVAPALQFEGRRLFEGGAPIRLALDRSVTSPAGYLLLDLSVR